MKQGNPMKPHLDLTVLTTCLVAAIPGTAWAQDDEEGQIQQRYDAALAATLDPALTSANDTRYTWASEAKVQCAIALGYFKSGTRDETSISKCNMASEMMLRRPAPPAPPPPPPPPPPACPSELPGIVFFDWDSAEVPPDAHQTAQFVSTNATRCNWHNITVTGHTDKSGSNQYNLGLSQRRAEAVANLLASSGVPSSSINTAARGEEQPRVPTADGVREPQNRRVEITVR
jgi:outer membrane protein OmpA-like peptidoglycan-associated protein